jgi:NTP pyrophosphatase (non-canonical NTP hydrolase)
MRVTSADVGSFVDSVAGTIRSPAAVAGRALEEMVELCLAASLTSGQIMEHVADALHNQALKATVGAGITVFPSQLQASPHELAEECADVSLVLKDLCHVAKIDLDAEEIKKYTKFVKKTFRVSTTGTLYATKPHVFA